MKDTIEQALADRIKTVRTAIRLRHSIEADRELNEAIDKVKIEFFKKVQAGELPDGIDIKRLLGE